MQNLYIIQCQEYYKIGVANDVESRLSQLSTGNPYPLKVLTVYEFDNAEFVERSLHQKYKLQRTRGEWFSLKYEDLVDIHKVCLMLGGSAYEYTGQEATEESIQEVEELQETVLSGSKWDYTQMYKDGWRIEKSSSKGVNDRYWCWRSRSGSREYIYGGLIAELPYPIDEMRKIYSED